MNKQYAVAYQNIEQAKKELLTNLAQVDATTLAASKNDKWSPIEHCYHLYLAEKGSRKYCIKKLSFNPELQKAGLQNQFRMWGLKITEILPIKFKAPNAIGDQAFPKDLNLDMVKKVWEQDRIELKEFLDNLNPEYIDKIIYKHPFMGRVTLGGMLDFFQFHMKRHSNHIRRDYGIG